MVFIDDLPTSRMFNPSSATYPFPFVISRALSISFLTTMTWARRAVAHRPPPSIAAFVTGVLKIIDFWRLEGVLRALTPPPALHKVADPAAQGCPARDGQPEIRAFSAREADLQGLIGQGAPRDSGKTRPGGGAIFEGGPGT